MGKWLASTLLALAMGAPLAALAATSCGGGSEARSASGIANDYPTSARANYVFACMAVNGETHEALDRCSCSIDVIASILPYKDYVSAETVLSMQQEKSYMALMFQTASAKTIVRRLREAEAEGEVRCF